MAPNKSTVELHHVIYLYYLLLRVIELVISKKRKEKFEPLEEIGVPFKFFEVQQEDGESGTQWTRMDGNTPFLVIPEAEM